MKFNLLKLTAEYQVQIIPKRKIQKVEDPVVILQVNLQKSPKRKIEFSTPRIRPVHMSLVDACLPIHPSTVVQDAASFSPESGIIYSSKDVEANRATDTISYFIPTGIRPGQTCANQLTQTIKLPEETLSEQTDEGDYSGVILESEEDYIIKDTEYEDPSKSPDIVYLSEHEEQLSIPTPTFIAISAVFPYRYSASSLRKNHRSWKYSYKNQVAVIKIRIYISGVRDNIVLFVTFFDFSS